MTCLTIKKLRRNRISNPCRPNRNRFILYQARKLKWNRCTQDEFDIVIRARGDNWVFKNKGSWWKHFVLIFENNLESWGVAILITLMTFLASCRWILCSHTPLFPTPFNLLQSYPTSYHQTTKYSLVPLAFDAVS